MVNENLIKAYKSKSGKKAIVNGEETIGFKRWKPQKPDSRLDDAISTFRANFRKDINNNITKIPKGDR